MALKEKRVLVTRAREQAAALVRALNRKGAIAVEIPAIRIVPAENLRSLCDAVIDRRKYDWLVFTSVNGVRFFFKEMSSRRGADTFLNRVNIAAIGPATVQALKEQGVTATAVPLEYRGEAVANTIIDRYNGNLEGVSALLFRAEGSREVLPEMLRRAGATVDVVEAYRAELPPKHDAERLLATLEQKKIDVVTFTSSSTVINTLKMLGEDAPRLLSDLTIASIGPITTDTALKHGLRVAVTATDYTIDGLVDVLDDYFTG
jgi:uroporphyrinogen III methyltransferase / synthase